MACRFSARHAGIFVADAGVDGEPRSHFPIVSDKPVHGIVVRGDVSGASAAKRLIRRAVGNEIIYKLTDGRVVPLTSETRNAIRWSDVLLCFRANLEGMGSADVVDGICPLVNVLSVALRSVLLRADVDGRKVVNDHVGEVLESTRSDDLGPTEREYEV